MQGSTASTSTSYAQGAAGLTNGQQQGETQDDKNTRRHPKILVLCFDGTYNQFNDSNTNVVKLFQLLDKSDPSTQMCYYQPGLGTYTLPSIVTPITSFVTKVIDLAVAWFFAAHVTGGYRFIVDNWLPGDKICLFGFSRGSYTARALAGMIEKVGLIPADNDEQLRFAWQMYKGTDKESFRLAKGFKETFSRDVDVDYVGVWDTVSAVGGIIEHHYPYTAKNKSIRVFRHALSLDERRGKYGQHRYHANTDNVDDAKDDPEHASGPCIGTGLDGKPCTQEDTWTADVKEVYFAGDHTGVGGGGYKDSEPRQLSNIPFMWMISQIINSGVGIKFAKSAFDELVEEYEHASTPTVLPTDTGASSDDPRMRNADVPTPPGKAASGAYFTNANIQPDVEDSLTVRKLSDLITVPFWWILEFFPFKRRYQDLDSPEKKWKVTFWPNFGRPRIVAPGSLIHTSVRDKMALNTGKKYKPKAKLPINVEWVDTEPFHIG